MDNKAQFIQISEYDTIVEAEKNETILLTRGFNVRINTISESKHFLEIDRNEIEKALPILLEFKIINLKQYKTIQLFVIGQNNATAINVSEDSKKLKAPSERSYTAYIVALCLFSGLGIISIFLSDQLKKDETKTFQASTISRKKYKRDNNRVLGKWCFRNNYKQCKNYIYFSENGKFDIIEGSKKSFGTYLEKDESILFFTASGDIILQGKYSLISIYPLIMLNNKKSSYTFINTKESQNIIIKTEETSN